VAHKKTLAKWQGGTNDSNSLGHWAYCPAC